jgi:hypothetical protein
VGRLHLTEDGNVFEVFASPTAALTGDADLGHNSCIRHLGYEVCAGTRPFSMIAWIDSSEMRTARPTRMVSIRLVHTQNRTVEGFKPRRSAAWGIVCSTSFVISEVAVFLLCDG